MSLRHGLRDPSAVSRAMRIAYWDALATSVLFMLVYLASFHGVLPDWVAFVTLVYEMVPLGLLIALAGRLAFLRQPAASEGPPSAKRLAAFAVQIYGVSLAACGLAAFAVCAISIALASSAP